MSRIKFLEEEIASKRSKIEEINSACETEKRARNEEEKGQWTTLKEEIRALEEELTDLKELEEDKAKRAAAKAEEERKAAAAAGGGASKGEEEEQNKIKETYKFSRAWDSLMNGKPLDGLEREMHEEADKEARSASAKISITGVGIPAFMVNPEKRTDVDQTTAGIQPTVVQGYVDAIRESAVYEQVIPSGNIMHGLTADVKLTKIEANSLAWATAENSAAADGGANPGKDTLAPVRLTGYVDVSNRVTMQNGEVVINAIMRDLGRETANKIDASLFSTANVTNAPGSIAATSGVGTFTEAASYAASSATANGSVYDDILAARQTLANSGALQGSLAYVGHSKLMSDIHKSPKVISVSAAAMSSTGSPAVYNVDGLKFVLTTACTSNGTTSADFVLGDFSKVYVGFFGGMDMVLDPWSVHLNDQKRIIVHRHLDTSLLQGGAFVKSTTLLS